ncbi:MAG TPA: GNAT family N-acetyltransferase [Puia sp.]|jgi:GNAT superfamily N-acetyltransferase|nr:GNAT family N-acetyltransferase [Puia sp.]
MIPKLSIRFAEPDDINTIGWLAQQTWPETYGHIITAEQMQYMLNLFYNPLSLRRQMLEEKQQFLMVEQDEEPIGFASWAPMAEPGVYRLHKLYVLPGIQGKGMGKAMLNFIFEDIRGARALRLNVNRYNKALQFYERMGFVIIGEEDIDIGNNYWMNDYILEKAI